MAMLPFTADAARFRWDLDTSETNSISMNIDVFGLGGLITQDETATSSLDPAFGGNTLGGYGTIFADLGGSGDGTVIFDAQFADGIFSTNGFKGGPLSWFLGPVGPFFGVGPSRIGFTSDGGASCPGLPCGGYVQSVAGLAAFGPTAALPIGLGPFPTGNIAFATQQVINPVFPGTGSGPEFIGVGFGGTGIPGNGQVPGGTLTMLSATDFIISDLISVFSFTTTFVTLGSAILTTVTSVVTLNLIGSIVPEPSSLVLLGAGIFALAAYRRFRAS
jgi:hypothetical protein